MNDTSVRYLPGFVDDAHATTAQRADDFEITESLLAKMSCG